MPEYVKMSLEERIRNLYDSSAYPTDRTEGKKGGVMSVDAENALKSLLEEFLQDKCLSVMADPVTEFTERAKSGEYDSLSDMDYNLAVNAVDRYSIEQKFRYNALKKYVRALIRGIEEIENDRFPCELDLASVEDWLQDRRAVLDWLNAHPNDQLSNTGETGYEPFDANKGGDNLLDANEDSDDLFEEIEDGPSSAEEYEDEEFPWPEGDPRWEAYLDACMDDFWESFFDSCPEKKPVPPIRSASSGSASSGSASSGSASSGSASSGSAASGSAVSP